MNFYSILRVVRLSPEPHLLSAFGNTSGNCLKSVRFEFYSDGPPLPLLSDVDCWRNFVENCKKLTNIEFRYARISTDAFAQLGRSQSLRDCSFLSDLHPLSADHLCLLADIRIGEGLQHRTLIVHNSGGHKFYNDFDLTTRLKSAGIRVCF